MIAVHTLAAAALQVLADLGANAGVESMVKNPQSVRPEKRKFVADLMNATQNFFKHADRDPEAILDFYPDATPFYIVDAALMCEALQGHSSAAGKAFHVWFMLNYPDILVDERAREHVGGLLADDPSLVEKSVALRLLRTLEAANDA